MVHKLQIDEISLTEEWRSIEYHFSELEVVGLKNFEDEIVFPTLSKLAKYCLALPKKRNKLSHKNLNAICVVRSSLQNSEESCVTFKCNENHFKKMRATNIYDHHKEIL